MENLKEIKKAIRQQKAAKLEKKLAKAVLVSIIPMVAVSLGGLIFAGIVGKSFFTMFPQIIEDLIIGGALAVGLTPVILSLVQLGTFAFAGNEEKAAKILEEAKAKGYVDENNKLIENVVEKDDVTPYNDLNKNKKTVIQKKAVNKSAQVTQTSEKEQEL